MARRLFEPIIPTRELNALRALSLLLGLALLVALVYGALTDRQQAVAYLGPAYGAVFLILLGGLALAARRAWWSWRFVGVVLMLGPLASAPGLERYARATRMSFRPGPSMRAQSARAGRR